MRTYKVFIYETGFDYEGCEMWLTFKAVNGLEALSRAVAWCANHHFKEIDGFRIDEVVSHDNH